MCGSGSDHGSSEENCVDESALYKVYGVRKEERERERERKKETERERKRQRYLLFCCTCRLGRRLMRKICVWGRGLRVWSSK